MKNLFLRINYLLAACLLLCPSFDLDAHTKFKPLKVLKGSIKGDAVVGDGYGTSSKLNDRFVTVGAPNAKVEGSD